MAMQVKVTFHSPTLARWLDTDARRTRLILLEVDANAISKHAVRLEFDLIFSPKSIRRNGVTRADYYIGSTGAELRVSPSRGWVSAFSKGLTVDANYTNSFKSARGFGVLLKPKVSVELPSAKLSGSAVAIQYGAGSELSMECSFRASERYLETEFARPEIKWSLALPRAQNVVRDYLQGNLNLFAECMRLDEGIKGVIEIRTSDIRFFCPERRPLGRVASLLMRYALWREGIHILSQDPESIDFEAEWA